MKSLRALVGAFAILLAPPFLGAQVPTASTQAESPPTFGERVEVGLATAGLAASSSRELQRLLSEIGQARRPESESDSRQAEMAESEAATAWHSIEAYAQAVEQDSLHRR